MEAVRSKGTTSERWTTETPRRSGHLSEHEVSLEAAMRNMLSQWRSVVI